MDTDEQKIKQIYYGITTKHYNPPISHFFEKYKKWSLMNLQKREITSGFFRSKQVNGNKIAGDSCASR